MSTNVPSVRDALLRRRGLVFLDGAGAPLDDRYLEALEIELSTLGYALSSRLREALSRLTLDDLASQSAWIQNTLAAQLGANQKHTPLFRKFPEAIPPNTHELWMEKVLSNFFQTEDQACLFCRRVGTTHVLSPCLHVVCDHCFDGSNYSACPICEHHVDLASPFFEPTPKQSQNFPRQAARLRLLDLGDSIDEAAKALFGSFCARPQAMSPADRDDLTAIVRQAKTQVLGWLPSEIPVKENIAIIFGTLFLVCDPSSVFPVAEPYLRTATDVLRLIAAYSGADPSLQGSTIHRQVTLAGPRARRWGRVLELLGGGQDPQVHYPVLISTQLHRFRVAKLNRPLRRSLLALLDGLDETLLTEDMLRHRSYWVWMGEFLHPGEYAKRYPKVARAFAVVRKKAPDGTLAPAFSTYYSKLERAARARDVERFRALLLERPGELARRLDHALRLAGDDAAATQSVLDAFNSKLASFATPVLLTLHAFFPSRLAPVKRRVFWPKGGVGRSVSTPDGRAPLRADVIRPALAAIRGELLRRYAERPHVEDFILDASLRDIVAPFNERTASRSAVSLPRGSKLAVPEGKLLRLFLHWCQPEHRGFETDLDLSVGFYDSGWKYSGVCSYYQLRYPEGRGEDPIAQSAGDLRDAPYPDGATELVDLDLARAKAAGLRYAVMVVNAYAGMPFGLLERAFAGLMLRDSPFGSQFDPRTVELKFSLAGEHGIYLPLVLDLKQHTVYWLDVHSQGELIFNNVETSNRAITKICPELIEYFDSGQRMSMFDLGLLHAAARADRVYVRGDEILAYERRPGESNLSFMDRIGSETGEVLDRLPGFERAVLALLLRGDLELPPGSSAYALFREQLTPDLAASDLIG